MVSRNYTQLHQAMQHLAHRCDGAKDRDGSGFNGTDTVFGHVLANTPAEQWSPKMAQSAHRMAQRYRGQLEKAGIDVAGIAMPDNRDQRSNRKKRVRHFDASIEDETVVLTSEYHPGTEAVEAVKACQGRKFRRTPSPRWIVPLSAAGQLLRAIEDGHVKAPPDVLGSIRGKLNDLSSAVQDSQRTDADFSVDGLGGELLPFQKAGVAYAVTHKRLWIADEMGLGKTVQAIATLLQLKAFPAVVVVPASLKLNWQRECGKWLPGVTVNVLSGRKPVPIDPSYNIVIVNYDVLAAWKSTISACGPKAIVLDESQCCKSGKAQRTKAARSIAKGVPVRLLLSGTPVVNSPPDLISQLQILGRLDDLGGFRTFADRYCIPSPWGGFQRGGKNLEELNARMRAGGMFVRRLKSVVLPELPSKRRVLVPLELKNARKYQAEQKRVAANIKKARIERAAAQREGREPEGWSLAASVTGIAELRKVAAECKMDSAMQWIREMLEAREKLVIFGWHVEVVERIAEELASFNCKVIRGGVKTGERQAAVDTFQNDPGTMAIALNIKAGGVGLTLTASSNVVFVESGWTPADNDQAEDRCHRFGQTDSVTAWYLLGDGTIDQWMNDLVAKKRRVVDASTEGSESAQRSMVEELADMLEALA